MARSFDPEYMAMLGRIGAHRLHSRYDSRDLTKAARAAALSRFERAVDPDGILPEAERLRRAEHAKKAYFAALALKSAQVRALKSRRSKARRDLSERPAA